jgi:hypothetical protein
MYENTPWSPRFVCNNQLKIVRISSMNRLITKTFIINLVLITHNFRQLIAHYQIIKISLKKRYNFGKYKVII